MEGAHVVKSILVRVIVRVLPGYSHLSGTGITQTFTISDVYRGAVVGAAQVGGIYFLTIGTADVAHAFMSNTFSVYPSLDHLEALQWRTHQVS